MAYSLLCHSDIMSHCNPRILGHFGSGGEKVYPDSSRNWQSDNSVFLFWRFWNFSTVISSLCFHKYVEVAGMLSAFYNILHQWKSQQMCAFEVSAAVQTINLSFHQLFVILLMEIMLLSLNGFLMPLTCFFFFEIFYSSQLECLC